MSVDDVEGVSKRSVECRPGGFIKAPDWFIIQILNRNSDDVVATDDAGFG
jgi:hypothetical protein